MNAENNIIESGKRKAESGNAEADLAGRLAAAHTVIRTQEADVRRLEWCLKNVTTLRQICLFHGNIGSARLRELIDVEMAKEWRAATGQL